MVDNSTKPARRSLGSLAFFFGLIFFFAFVFVCITPGLHGESNPIFVLIWLALGVVATCVVAAAREDRAPDGSRSRLGRVGLVLTGFGWIFGCMAVFGPHHDPHASDIRRQVRCASNLKTIGQAILLYANENGGRYPDRPEELMFTQDITAEVFVCPSTDDTPLTGSDRHAISDAFASGGHFSYIYLGTGLNVATVESRRIVACESSRNHTRDHPGIHVLYGNGGVEFIEQPVADQLIYDLKNGSNPPPMRLKR